MVNFIYKISDFLISRLEEGFYRWGKFVVRKPWLVIFGTFLLSGLAMVGFLKIRFVAEVDKLFLPYSSNYLKHQKWVGEHFTGDGRRVHIGMFESNTNLLTPLHLIEMSKFRKAVSEINVFNVTFEDICYPIPIADIFLNKRRKKRETKNSLADFFESAPDPFKRNGGNPAERLPPSVYCDLIETLNTKCLEDSILSIWKYDESQVNALTTEEILFALNNVRRSPQFGYPINYLDRLGGKALDANNKTVGAKAALHIWGTTVDKTQLVKGNLAGLELQDADRVTLAWEERVIDLTAEFNRKWKDEGIDLILQINMARSFGDASSSAIFLDGPKMLGGYALMLVYTFVMLGQLNRVEQRVILSCAGIAAVILGMLASIGLSAAFGIPYITLHAMLPFICLGIGIDDLFVIVQCLNNLTPEERQKPLEERIGLTMRHAGVAITVTSLTDVCAFGVGAISTLFGLTAFCVTSAIAIGWIYCMQASWVVAWLVIDERRIESKRDGCLPCIKYSPDWKPNKFSQRQLGVEVMAYYAKLLDYKLYKAIVILITAFCTAVGLWGTALLRTEFDPIKLLPPNSYLKEFVFAHNRWFPSDGWDAEIVIGAIKPSVDLQNMETVIVELHKLRDSKTLRGVVTWWEPFKNYIARKDNITDWKTIVDINDEPGTDVRFRQLLSDFLFHTEGANFRTSFQFSGKLKCGEPVPVIVASKFNIFFWKFGGPDQYIPAKHSVDKIMGSFNWSETAFANSQIFAAWETDEVIASELWQNILVSGASVFIITLILLTDVVISLIVLFCVALTVINLMGYLHFWGMTIDMLSCVNIVLAIGLCVDYSAHIAHAFITSKGDKQEKAKQSITTIGAAIMNGGITTFLALIFLSDPKSHVFVTFFRVFMLTVLFGLFHGIVFLPVLLSIIGPRFQHHIDEKPESGSPEASVSMDAGASPDLSAATTVGMEEILHRRRRTSSTSQKVVFDNKEKLEGGLNNPAFLPLAEDEGPAADDQKTSHKSGEGNDGSSSARIQDRRWHPFQKLNTKLFINKK